MKTRILVVGDTHIPDRARGIPAVLKRFIETSKPWDLVAFTGDLTEESVLRWIKTLGRQVYVVRGNMDYLQLPRVALFKVEEFKIGVHHGDGVHPRGDTDKLTKIAVSLGADLLLTGHTHVDFVKLSRDATKLLINPGSLTGVWSGEGGSYIPSFIVLSAEGNYVRIEVYRFTAGKLGIEVVCTRKTGNTFEVESCS